LLPNGDITSGEELMTTDNLVNRLHAHARRLRAAEHGNVLLTFALALVPIMGAVGAAVDYSRANNILSQIQAAADAASVGSVAKSSPAMKAAASMTSDGPIPVGVTDALNIFNAQLAGKSGFSNLSVSATVAKANSDVTSTVQFTASVPTVIMGIFSKGSMAINGTAKAANGIPLYVDFYVLLDNTPSMGVGATTADINTMVANTPDQCAFACHDLSTHPNNYYQKAKKLGVQMRIDVVRSATQQLMDTAADTETITNQFRAAIYTFGDSCTNPGLTTIKALTSNLSSAKSAAKNIDLMTIPYQGYNNDQCTNLDKVLTDINNAIPTPGSGTTSSSPQKYLFFVSDGVNDANNPSSCSKPLTGGTRCQEPIDVSFCTTIKNRGVKIAVLYTTYLPLPTNPWYNSWIAPFQSEIGTKMQACASPGLYFEVSPSQGISDAMNALFKKAMAQAHLTK
jgi:Flp pilus assembly protein TadG